MVTGATRDVVRARLDGIPEEQPPKLDLFLRGGVVSWILHLARKRRQSVIATDRDDEPRRGDDGQREQHADHANHQRVEPLTPSPRATFRKEVTPVEAVTKELVVRSRPFERG
jgi:hypothetical protein